MNSLFVVKCIEGITKAKEPKLESRTYMLLNRENAVCSFEMVILDLVSWPIKANPGHYFQKTGGDSGDIPETFSRHFPDFAISGCESHRVTQGIRRELFPGEFLMHSLKQKY